VRKGDYGDLPVALVGFTATTIWDETETWLANAVKANPGKLLELAIIYAAEQFPVDPRGLWWTAANVVDYFDEVAETDRFAYAEYMPGSSNMILRKGKHG
jgi:hypothetical protein